MVSKYCVIIIITAPLLEARSTPAGSSSRTRGSVDDRLALARDTGACEILRLGDHLGRLDDHDLLRLGAILRGGAGAARR